LLRVLNFLVEVASTLLFGQIVTQHLTHINNISVLFVVDLFESANNMFVDEIENKYLLGKGS